MANYAPGEWVAISAPGTWLLIDCAPEDPIVEKCWRLISGTPGADDVLDLLVASGIRSTPAFALVREAPNERRAIARGAAAVTISDESGAVVAKVAAAAGAVWADETFPSGVDLTLAADATHPRAAVSLPMHAGVTMASVVAIRTQTTAVPPRGDSTPSRPAASAPGEPTAAVPAVPEDDDAGAPSTYDHLFRLAEPEASAQDESAAGGPDAPTETAEEAQSPLGETRSYLTSSASEVPPPTTEIAVPHVPPATSTNGLIDSVPWAPSVPVAAPVAPPPPPPPAVAPPPPPAVAPPPPAAATTPAPPTAASPPETEVSKTVNRAALRAAAEAAHSGPSVLAGYCPAGHLSPVNAAVCRVCQAPMPPGQQGVEVARPPLGVLRLSTGDVVTLDRGVLLGRAPEAPPDTGERPHVLRLASPENDISRLHAEVVLEGWHVYVRDLGSTNGTVVTLPGQQPQRLRPNDPQLLEPGAIVSLADEISFTFEVGG